MDDLQEEQRSINIDEELGEQWKKILIMVLWKLAKNGSVIITGNDIVQAGKEFAPGMPVLLTHWSTEELIVQLVTEEVANKMQLQNVLGNFTGTAQ